MSGSAQYELVKVIGAWDETRALRAIRLRLPAHLAAAHACPGQVVKVRTANAPDAFFALATAPDPAGCAELLVKRNGRIAEALVASASPGRTIELTPPFGAGFPLSAGRGRDLLLFAAGSGIAPIRALLQEVERRREDFGRVTLFYGQRRHADFAYRHEYLAWERRGVRVVLCASAHEGSTDASNGRVHDVARAVALCGTDPREAEAFVCGMPAMVEDVRRTLADMGVPPARVHTNA